ncbi:hypothetical protein TOK_1926 [Pseudonocardia sp. N23]|nr:hypothetical protein TOK_1926 [Pseudonocardia sp. N23]
MSEYRTPYEQRIDLVTAVVTANPSLPAGELATAILYALDHIPEKVR